MNKARFEEIQQWLCELPHSRLLGLSFVSRNEDTGEVTLALPYQEALIGNPATGVLHGGAVTALVDTASCLAVFSRLEAAEAVATLDLRLDYLHVGKPEMLYCTAECYALTPQIAFTRTTVWQGSPKELLIATSVATFMRASSQRFGGLTEESPT